MEPGGVTIVGIGASAGGLGAFEAFFSAMPANANPGMAFVLIQHLAPDHKSLLRELVSRYTTMPVLEAEDGMRVEANKVYIIPPNRDMSILHGSLQLFEPTAARGLRLPIDVFFRALAEDQHARAIGIVLSGTASDGTLGARAIKGEGGLVMAQSPDTTEHDGMPAAPLPRAWWTTSCHLRKCRSSSSRLCRAGSAAHQRPPRRARAATRMR